MRALVIDGTCRNCGKAIRETSPQEWTHYKGEYYCNGRDITDQNHAEPDRETREEVHRRQYP